jgi:transcriptional regulator with XRE-family HTH domain
MTIGDRITSLRKAKNISQADLAKVAGVSREIIGRYERNDASPSIEVAKKIAEALEVSLDYLSGSELSVIDRITLKRLEEIEKLDTGTKEHLFFLIDNVIQNFKTKQAFSK